MCKLYQKIVMLSLYLGITGMVHAGILIDSTRVIYPAEKKEVTLGMINKASEPRLVQAWIDQGDNDQEKIKVPFVVIPPVFRVDPEKGQTIRIIFTGGSIPQDRESVLWLNLLEIKPKLSNENNHMKFSVRSRLKIFYRPTHLPGSQNQAINDLQWRLILDGSKHLLECFNPSSYNVSFSDLSFKGAENKETSKQSGMCPAKEKKAFPLEIEQTNTQGKLILTTINDYGGFDRHEVPYTY
ncbi:fimbrial biogenesis chaperone [Serratia fonticola]|uniref:fimbrial biogenesis chaperone n=1 Tax=Serratia fonticola TaxID=47917 RepID=UPI0021798813|nr:molecular chaperone [Serratia fonticola]CAI1217945.1 Chaperone protein focC precursor [Serratia fonticola]CAI1223870.1 Chaperone protein focC precursor [Serratia fonticola]